MVPWLGFPSFTRIPRDIYRKVFPVSLAGSGSGWSDPNLQMRVPVSQ